MNYSYYMVKCCYILFSIIIVNLTVYDTVEALASGVLIFLISMLLEYWGLANSAANSCDKFQVVQRWVGYLGITVSIIFFFCVIGMLMGYKIEGILLVSNGSMRLPDISVTVPLYFLFFYLVLLAFESLNKVVNYYRVSLNKTTNNSEG